MKTRAAVLPAPRHPFQIEELDLAPPKAGEVRVKIAAAGVCHSDWHLVTGATTHALPVVPGHEGAGIVDAIGPGVTRLGVGDHVALNWAPACGHCFYCLHDKPNLCETYTDPTWAGTLMDGTTRFSRDGAPVYQFSALGCFAEYCVVPVECCVVLPKTVPLTVAALIGCAVTTGVGAVLTPVLEHLGGVSGLVLDCWREAGGVIREEDLAPVAEHVTALLPADPLLEGHGYVADIGLVRNTESHFMMWWQMRGARATRLRLNSELASLDLYDYARWAREGKAG